MSLADFHAAGRDTAAAWHPSGGGSSGATHQTRNASAGAGSDALAAGGAVDRGETHARGAGAGGSGPANLPPLYAFHAAAAPCEEGYRMIVTVLRSVLRGAEPAGGGPGGNGARVRDLWLGSAPFPRF